MNKRIIGKAVTGPPEARIAGMRISAAWRFASLLLLGLLAVAGMRPAAATPARTGHFMVSVRVVHHCQYRIGTSSRKSSVVRVVMHGCDGNPRISTRGFVAISKQNLAGSNTTRYLLRETHRISMAGARYIEIDF